MEKININRRVIDNTNIFQVTNDIIVPDIKPDIINIIAINGIPYVYKQNCENGRIKMEGNIDSYIIYLSADGETRSIQTTFNFTNFLENENIRENSNFKYNIDIDSMDCKILNERKVSVSATLSLKYVISEMQNIEISDDFLNNIPLLQKKEENVCLKSLVGLGNTKASIKEELNIENLDEIAEILKVDINVTNGEQKISYNKILTKGECNISIMYMTEDNRIGIVKDSFSIMSFVDIENVKEQDECVVEYNIKNMLLKINNRDEHSITVQIDFDIACEVYEEKRLNILKDAYSLSNDIDIGYKTIEIDTSDDNNDEIIDINENVRIEDIKKVWCVQKNKIIISKTNNTNIEGEINLSVYYEVMNKPGVNIKELKIPFIAKIKKSNNINVIYKDLEFNLRGEEVHLDIKLLVVNNEKNYNKINIIDKINVRDSSDLNDYNVVVYMVKKNDSIWEIAKKFKVTMDNIIKVNNLENPEMIYPGDKLYILR